MSNDRSVLSAQNLIQQVGQSLVPGDIILARLQGGYKAEPIHDENYPQDQKGFVMQGLSDRLAAQHPEIAPEPESAAPEPAAPAAALWKLT